MSEYSDQAAKAIEQKVHRKLKRTAACMAEAFNLPVVSHVIPEFHAHLIAAVPNGLTVEYMPWTLTLFEETPRLDRGQLVLTDKPGFGLKFDAAAVKAFSVG